MRPNKRHLIGIVTVMIAAIGLVGLLAWAALEPVAAAGNFTRHSEGNKLALSAVVEKNAEIAGFAGMDDHNIYFRTKSPSKIYVTDHQMQNGKFVSINVPDNNRIRSSFQMEVSDDGMYVLAGNANSIFKTSFDGLPAQTLAKTGSLFTRSAMIDSKTFVLREIDNLSPSDQVFVKHDIRTGIKTRENNISERRHDAGITTDGLLNYDKTTGLIVYVFFYRGEFLCIDTNMNLVRRVKTIDTTENIIAEVSKDTNRKDKTSFSRSVNRIVNQLSKVSDGYLFNWSNILSGNEPDRKGKAVIDMYDLRRGEYAGSFYIPAYGGRLMKNFTIMRDRLYVLYPEHIVSYTFFLRKDPL